MAATQSNPRASHVPSFFAEEYSFPSKQPTSPKTSILRRPASTSSIKSGSSGPTILTSAPSECVPTPAASPTSFTFPNKPTSTSGSLRFPNSPPQSPNPPVGEHARRQSESTAKLFNNGSLAPNFTFGSPGPKSVSASPSRGSLSPKNSLAPPMEKGTAAPPPSGMAGRRGHAHRRSAAMSSGDVLSVMLHQNNNSRSPAKGSAPTSPSLDKPVSPDAMDIDSASSRPQSSAGPVPVSPPTPSSLPSSPILSGLAEPADSFTDDLPRKSRVTFNDAPEIIPRPASAGTCSTMTTIRGGSISSMASFTPSEYGSPDKRRASASDAAFSVRTKAHRPKELQRRPSSADASTILHSATKSTWIFPPLSPSSKPTAKHPKSQKSPKSPKKKGSSKHSRSGSGSLKGSIDAHSDSRKHKSSMKGWAGSILLRRHYRKRQLRASPRRSPTPPLMQRSEIQRLMNGGSYVLMPTNTADDNLEPPHDDDDMEFEAQIDLGDYDSDDDERISGEYDYPIIDLDAALGPFNTPTSPNIPTGFDAAKLRMHSAAGWAPFHRRAESMPEMQLFSLAEDEIEDDGMGDVFEDSEAEMEDADVRPSTDSEASQDQMQWSTTGAEGSEELDILDGVAFARKGLRRKMSLVVEVRDTEESAEQSPQGLGLEESVATLTQQIIPSPPASPLPTPPAEAAEPTKRGAFPFHLSSITQWAYSTIADHNGTQTGSTADSTPLVTPSTGTMSASTPTTAPSPPTPQNLEFLTPPRAPSLIPDDDRSTLVSVPSIYEDPVLLGEPGPEMRLSISMDDIPRITHSSSAAVLGFYPHPTGNLSAVTVPGILPRSRGSMSTTGTDHIKEKKDKKWGKFLNFWRSKA